MTFTYDEILILRAALAESGRATEAFAAKLDAMAAEWRTERERHAERARALAERQADAEERATLLERLRDALVAADIECDPLRRERDGKAICDGGMLFVRGSKHCTVRVEPSRRYVVGWGRGVYADGSESRFGTVERAVRTIVSRCKL